MSKFTMDLNSYDDETPIQYHIDTIDSEPAFVMGTDAQLFAPWNAAKQRLREMIHYPHPLEAFDDEGFLDLESEWIKERISATGLPNITVHDARLVDMTQKAMHDELAATRLRDSAKYFNEMFQSAQRNEICRYEFASFYSPEDTVFLRDHRLDMHKLIFDIDSKAFDEKWVPATSIRHTKVRKTRVLERMALVGPKLKKHFDGQGRLKEKSYLKKWTAKSLGLTKEFYDWFFGLNVSYISFRTGKPECGPDLEEFRLESRAALCPSPLSEFRQFKKEVQENPALAEFRELVRYVPLKCFGQRANFDWKFYQKWVNDACRASNESLLSNGHVPPGIFKWVEEAALLSWKHISHEDRFKHCQKFRIALPDRRTELNIDSIYDENCPFYHPNDVNTIYNLLYSAEPLTDGKHHDVQRNKMMYKTLGAELKSEFRLIHDIATRESRENGEIIRDSRNGNADIFKKINISQLGSRYTWDWLFLGPAVLRDTGVPQSIKDHEWQSYEGEASNRLSHLLELCGMTYRGPDFKLSD